MPQCQVCDGDDFRLVDGLYYCIMCSTQSQEIAQQEQLQMVDMPDQNNKSFLGRKGVGRKRGKRRILDKGKPWRLVEGFQVILKVQVKKLINAGCKPSLDHTVKQIWLAFVHAGGFAEINSHLPVKKKYCNFESIRDDYVQSLHDPEGEHDLPCKSLYNSQALLKLRVSKKLKERKFSESDDSDSKEAPQTEVPQLKLRRRKKLRDRKVKVAVPSKKKQVYSTDQEWFSLASSESEDDFMHGSAKPEEKNFPNHHYKRNQYRAIAISKKNSGESLDMCKLLAILYLGLQWIGETSVTLPDLIRWAKQGYIPYLNSLNYLEPHMRLVEGDNTKLKSQTIQSYEELAYVSEKILKFISIAQFPDTDMKPLITRYINELNLPRQFICFTCHLMKTIKFTYNRKKRPHKHVSVYTPHVVAVALIVISVKLLLGLDDKREHETGHQEEGSCDKHQDGCQTFNWSTWVSYHLRRRDEARRNPATVFDVDDPDQIEDVSSIAQHASEVVLGLVNKEETSDQLHLERLEAKRAIFRNMIEDQGSWRTIEDSLERLIEKPYRFPLPSDNDDMRECCISHLIQQSNHSDYVHYTDGYARKETCLQKSDLLTKASLSLGEGRGFSGIGNFHHSYLFILSLCKEVTECLEESFIHLNILEIERQLFNTFI